MPNLRNGIAKGSRTLALSIASLAFYHLATALHKLCIHIKKHKFKRMQNNNFNLNSTDVNFDDMLYFREGRSSCG